MQFRLFLLNEQKFTVDGAEVVITEEVDSNLLNFINNQVRNFATKVSTLVKPGEPSPLAPAEPMKKFKVTIKYPKNQRGSKLGHYYPETLYVFASTPNQAKEKAEQHVKSKGKPYLKDLKRKYMGTRAVGVKTWKELTELVKHLGGTKKGATPLLYLEEPDLQVLLRQSKKRSFFNDVKKLGDKEQRILKSFFYHMSQKPLSDETKKMMDPEAIKNIKKLSTKELRRERLPGEDEPEQTDWQEFWSVFEPRSDEEESKLLSNIHSTKDLFNVAYRYGISPRDLRGVREELFGAKNRYEEGVRNMWKSLYKDLRVRHGLSHRNKLFQTSDYTNPVLAKKYGVNWDLITREWMAGTNSGEENYFPFSKGSPEKEAAEWLWQFYSGGLPPKSNTLKQYKAALDYLLERRNRDDNVPF